MKCFMLPGAIPLAAVALFFSHPAQAADGIRAPYTAMQGMVMYQPGPDVEPERVPDASVTDFTVLYGGDVLSIAQSQGRYYCNAKKLPKGFHLDTATVSERVIFSNVGTFSGCERLPESTSLPHPPTR